MTHFEIEEGAHPLPLDCTLASAGIRGNIRRIVNLTVLFVLVVALTAYFLAGRFYAAFLSRTLGVDPTRPTPAVEKNDGRDYVPAKPYVLFAHHFAAIAGAGPIVGPTLAVAYGYLPALVWVILGAIFIGGMHDMCTLFISTREQGRSIADIARNLLGGPGYILIVSFLLLGLFMITATFLNLSVTALTSLYPAEKVGLMPPEEAVLQAHYENHKTQAELVPFPQGGAMPTSVQKITVADGQGGSREGYQLVAKIGGIASTSVLLITAFAPFLGWLIYRRHAPAWLTYSLAAILCLASVLVGLKYPVVATADQWRLMMTVYVILASSIPVWLLLMPRDFVNVQILYGGIAAVFVGLLVSVFTGGFSSIPAAPQVAAETIPAFDFSTGMQYVTYLWPMLFITISCGAMSGFHCLVSSGTTAKQLSNESHARTVGYNAMLLESMLAVCVVLTLFVGLDWSNYQAITFGQKNPILAIALATGNLFHATFGTPVWMGTVLGILLLEGFVVTTLDVAVRLNRYLLEEFWRFLLPRPPQFLVNPWFNTGIAVAAMYFLSRSNTLPVLWQVFGSANQMMGAMALLIVAVWMRSHGRRYNFALIPAIFMFVTTLTSSSIALWQNWERENWALVAACAVLIGLGLGMVFLGGRMLWRQSVSAIPTRA